ncbi:hypothetical protein H4S06_003471 [Coemansia sp. BCRC 34490]|nr:hypothetical protein H4S06_003471 [Coemansia sp. BCRC 34490]
MSGRCFQVDLLLSMNFIILQPMDRERTVANEETEDVGVGVGVVVGTGAGAESFILTLICHDQHILRQ